jgi:hypothetical protein
MAITKPTKKVDSGDAFMGGAPDAKQGRWQRGNKVQITLSIAPELLERVDAIAHRKHLSRAALLTVWIGDALEREAA